MPDKFKRAIYTYSLPLLILCAALALGLLAASCAAIDGGGIVNLDPPSKGKTATIDLRVYLDPTFNVTASTPVMVIMYTNIENIKMHDFPMPVVNYPASSADSAGSESSEGAESAESAASVEQRFQIYTLTSAASVAMPKSSKAASSASAPAGSGSESSSQSANSSSSASKTSTTSVGAKWNDLSEKYVAKTITDITNSVIYLLAWYDDNPRNGILDKNEYFMGYDQQAVYNALTKFRTYASYTSQVSFLFDKTYTYQTGSLSITVTLGDNITPGGKRIGASLHANGQLGGSGIAGIDPEFSGTDAKKHTFVFSKLENQNVYIRVWLDDNSGICNANDIVSYYCEDSVNHATNTQSNATPVTIPPDIATHQYLIMTLQ